MEEIVLLVDNAVFTLTISRSVPEIFAIEVQSCPQSHRAVRLQNFFSVWTPKNSTKFSSQFGEVIPAGPKIIGFNTLNFKPILEFLLPQLFFSGEGTQMFGRDF